MNLKDVFTMTLGNKLRIARDAKGLGQKDVANLTGINYKTISNYENDRSEPDVENLAKLCRLYSVSADYFIDLDIEKAPVSESYSETEARAIQLYESLTASGFLQKGDDLTPKQIEFLDGLSIILSAMFK